MQDIQFLVTASPVATVCCMCIKLQWSCDMQAFGEAYECQLAGHEEDGGSRGASTLRARLPLKENGPPKAGKWKSCSKYDISPCKLA